MKYGSIMRRREDQTSPKMPETYSVNHSPLAVSMTSATMVMTSLGGIAEILFSLWKNF